MANYEQRKQFHDFFLKNLGNEYGVAGLWGNIYAESGGRPNNLQNSYESKLGYTDETYTKAVDNGTYLNFVYDSAGYGLAQWTFYSRKQNLLDFAKAREVSIADYQMQLDFIYKELSEYYKTTFETLKKATSVKEASDAVMTQYERPATITDQTKATRAKYGQEFYDEFVNEKPIVIVDGPTIVLNTARAELGYHEKASNNNLDDKYANSGDSNWTKFAREFDEKYPNFYNGRKNGYPWCDIFVDYLFLTNFGYEKALQLLCQPERSCGAGCSFSANYYRNMGKFHTKNPNPGDQIFFGDSSNVAHTGIVEKVTANEVHTIEGNSSDQVERRVYKLNDSKIYGYGTPRWELLEPVEIPVEQSQEEEEEKYDPLDFHPIVCMMHNSTCYQQTSKMQIKGVLWHSTGANNPWIKRYVQPDDDAPNRDELLALFGINSYHNDWNHKEVWAGLNAWIGKLADGTVATVQTMPWDFKPWGCGGGCNDGWIQFEICEDDLYDKVYFEAVYKEAVKFTAYICKLYGINPNAKVGNVPTILCHQDSYRLGMGSNHSDVYHWFKIYGKTMDDVRVDVTKLLGGVTPTPVEPKYGDRELYKGLSGNDVVELQKRLMSLNYTLPKYGADGDFGDETESAVKAFQKDNKLDVDGIVGPNTYAAIEEALKGKEIVVGDIVDFIGNNHYVSASSNVGKTVVPGKAKITKIYKLGESKHPYHAVAVAGGGSNVYGWVDENTIKK